MIESRLKNQKMAKNAIDDYQKQNPITLLARQLELIRFTKFLAIRMLERVSDDDCYTIDMIEDLEKLEEWN